jgi:hypothetical protein
MTDQKEIVIDIPDNEDVDFCCSNTKFGLVRYMTMISVTVGVMLFSAGMMLSDRHNLELRASFLPILTGTLFLLVNPRHD